MTDHKTQIRHALTDPAPLLEKLGLLETAKGNARRYTICCPWHQENDPSCDVWVHRNDGLIAVHCHGCGAGGDVYNLIAQVYGLSLIDQFQDVLQIAADFAGITIDNSKPVKYTPPKKIEPRPPEYPPKDELGDMWSNAVAPCDDDQVVKFFERRGISLDAIGDMCRVIPVDYNLPKWAIYRDEADSKGRYDWIMSGHRLIFPLYNHDGKIKSFKARNMGDSKLKNVNPLEYSAVGLCFADDNAWKMLSKNQHCETVVFVEGEIDFLQAVQLAGDDTAIFGIYSGCWSDEHSKKLNCDRVVFLTDVDEPGDRYAKQIAESVWRLK